MPPVRKNLGMNRYQASITHLEDTRKLSQIGKRKLLGKINQTGDKFEHETIRNPYHSTFGSKERMRIV